MVPIALLITHWWKEILHRKKVIIGSLLFPIIALLFYIGITITNKKEFYINSDKYLIENTAENKIPIYYWHNKSYSSQFYSKGSINTVENNDELNELIISNNPFLIIIQHKRIDKISIKNLALLKEIDRNSKKSIYIVNK